MLLLCVEARRVSIHLPAVWAYRFLRPLHLHLRLIECPQATPQRADAAGSKGSSVTVETVIREGESIIHGKGRLMHRRDRQMDINVSNTQACTLISAVFGPQSQTEQAHDDGGCNGEIKEAEKKSETNGDSWEGKPPPQQPKTPNQKQNMGVK